MPVSKAARSIIKSSSIFFTPRQVLMHKPPAHITKKGTNPVSGTLPNKPEDDETEIKTYFIEGTLEPTQ